MKTYLYIWYNFAKFFLEWEIVLENSCRENQNSHFMFNGLFPKIVSFMR